MEKIKKINVMLFGIWFLVVLSFLTTFPTDDFMVFWAYAKQVSYSSYNGLAAIVDVWELKGLLFRTIYYTDAFITSFFINDYSLLYAFVYKLVGLAGYFSLLLVIVRVIPKQYRESIGRAKLFFVLGILLLTVHFASHLQAEMWGVLFFILALALYLNDKVWCQIIAAIVYSLTFYLKSPMPLLGGTLFFGAMLIKKQTLGRAVKGIIPFVITTILFLFLSLFLIYRYYPQEITDICDASYYQHTLLQDGWYWGAIKNLIHGFIYDSFLYNIPCALGVIAALYLFAKWCKGNDYKQCALLVLTWVFPLVYIILSNCYFVYHYYLLVYPTIITLLLFHRENPMAISGNRPLHVILGTYMAYYMFVLSAVAPTNLDIKHEYTKIWEENKQKKGISLGCRMGGGEMLFLDSGLGAFIFNNKSYLRYFYVLPLQRISPDNPFTKTDTYKKVKQKAMAYNGEYLTLETDWFFKNGNDDIKEKIEKEYKLYAIIDIPEQPWDLFHIDKQVGHLYLYKRTKY